MKQTKKITEDEYRRELNYLVRSYNTNMGHVSTFANNSPTGKYSNMGAQMCLSSAFKDKLKIRKLQIKAQESGLKLYELTTVTENARYLEDTKIPYFEIDESGIIKDEEFFRYCKKRYDEEDLDEAFKGCGCLIAAACSALFGLVWAGEALKYYTEMDNSNKKVEKQHDTESREGVNFNQHPIDFNKGLESKVSPDIFKVSF